MCAGVTHAIMMHLFLFTQDACLALCSLQGHNVHSRVFFFHVQQPTTCPPVVGAPTAICGVPASKEGMEREWEEMIVTLLGRGRCVACGFGV